jgi:hypothetical protein
MCWTKAKLRQNSADLRSFSRGTPAPVKDKPIHHYSKKIHIFRSRSLSSGMIRYIIFIENKFFFETYQ